MKNIVTLPTIHWIQRLAMIVTLGCCAYIGFFIFYKSKDNVIIANQNLARSKPTALIPPAPVFDLRPNTVSPNDRDIFSLTNEVSAPNGVVENTPKGQLPDHLKVVGILIAHPSQMIIEDSLVHQTYFIEEGKPQAGISIVKVQPDQMIIKYQGQNISVPIEKY